MGRPSVKKQRTEEILQAYERCIAQYGVHGATLQKIADEAGIARPLLNHHVGSGDELLGQSVLRYQQRSRQAMAEYDQYFSAEGTAQDSAEDYVRGFFMINQEDDGSRPEHNDIVIAAAFTSAAQTKPALRQAMQDWFNEFEQGFRQQLQRFYPKATELAIRQSAAGIIGIYFNVESMASIGLDDGFRAASEEAAVQLLQPLAAA